jgi:hypothetical protein
VKRRPVQIAAVLFFGILTGCGGWDLKPSEDESTDPTTVCRLPPLPPAKNCPAIAYERPMPQPPQTQLFNVAQKHVSGDSVHYVSNGDFIYSYPSGSKVNLHESNALLLLNDERLYAIGKSSITVYDITEPSNPQKDSIIHIESEIAGARVVGENIIVMSQSVIDTIEHPAVRVNDCRGYPAYTENIYETKITRMSLENLEDDESVDLVGLVRFVQEGQSLRFIEPGPKQTTIERVVELLPDGQFGQAQVIATDREQPSLVR